MASVKNHHPIYFNLAGKYRPLLIDCMTRRLWIRENQQWWGPYHWALSFGVSYMGASYVAKTACPYELIRQAEILVQDRFSEERYHRIQEFKNKVDHYYKSRFDQKLKKSIESGQWVY